MDLGLRERAGRGIGASVPRIDGIPKVSGAFMYASDLWMADMLWGAALRSPHPHAAIRRVDVSAALASPGVHAVLLAGDIPGKNRFGLSVDDQPVLAETVVRFSGEPIALVAADTAALARGAVARIAVDFEPLPVLADMEEALRPGAPRLHEFGNVLRHVRILHGAPDDVAADLWVEGYYETGMQDQAPLGPEAGLAIPAEDGGVDLYVATQWLHADREQIAPCLALPEEKVRLHLAGVGGAFGSREDIHMQIHGCLLAMRTGRPVKMSLGREESFRSHVHRHPSRIWMRHGVGRDGRLVSVEARLLFDGGAYTSSSPAVVANAVTFAAGPYEVPNVRAEGTVVYTNNPPCGAMRGFGVPQVCFAHEAQMDKIADRLGVDPLQLRLANAVVAGSVLPTGQVLSASTPVRELITACRDLPWPDPEPVEGRHTMRYPGGAGNVTRGEGLTCGVGYAVGYKNVGFSEGFDDAAAARVTLGAAGPDGPVAEIQTAAVEMGQGLYTLLAQIVRTELGIDRVILQPADTLAGNAGSTSASRQSLMTGGAVQLACTKIRSELFERALRRSAGGPGDGAPRAAAADGAADAVVPGSEAPPDPGLALHAGQVLADGVAVAGIGSLLDEPITRQVVYRHRATQGFDGGGQGDIHALFAFAAERAIAEVDEQLGLVRVLQVAAAVDAGRVVNPLGFEGQVEGGTAQGLGLALMEEVQVSAGVIRNPSFTDYLIPTIFDVPPMVSAAVEVPEPGVPYGLKGVGESPTVVATAAIVAALRDATGRALNRAPVTPDELVGLRVPAVSAGPPPPPDVPGQSPVPYYYGMRPGQRRLM